jgi:preprotein translocase subunit SecE
MDGLLSYVRESWDELLNKVTWPTWTNLMQTTQVVLVATAILAFVIFGMDFISNSLLKLLYKV